MNIRVLGMFRLLSIVLLFVTTVRVDIAAAGGVHKGFLAWSPDGTQIAFSGVMNRSYSVNDLYVADDDGNHVRNLTNYDDTGVYFDTTDSFPYISAVWSPDSTSLAFVSEQLYLANSDGTQLQVLASLPAHNRFFFWSSESRVFFQGQGNDNQPDIYSIDIDGSNLQNLTAHSAGDRLLSISPDGNQIAFLSDREGSQELYVMDADGSNLRRVTSDSAEEFFTYVNSRNGQEVMVCSRDDNESRGIEVYYGGRFERGDDILIERLSDDDVRCNLLWQTDQNANGELLVFDANNSIYLVESDGSNLQPLIEYGAWREENNISWSWSQAVSPDGSAIAVSLFTKSLDHGCDEIGSHLYVMDLQTDRLHRLHKCEEGGHWPDWSPDGTQLAFMHVYMNADGDWVEELKVMTREEIFEMPVIEN